MSMNTVSQSPTETTIQKEARQIKMFGMTEAQVWKDYEIFYKRGDVFSMTHYAMSILSNAQELIANGYVETARQFINQAKLILSEVSVITHPANAPQKRDRIF